MTSRRTLTRAAAVLAATMVAGTAATVLAGCSVQSSSSASSAGTSPSGSSSATAPARFGGAAPGVTASTIKLGIVYPDYASLAAYGLNINQGSFPDAYNALIAKINAAGGVDGRKIVPVYGKYSLLSPAASTQTCVQLTADDKVFAVVGTFESDTQALCYAQTHKTAVVGSALSDADYALAQAPWFAVDHGSDDAGSAIDTLYASGQLTGKKVAIIALQQDATSMNQSAIPALKAKGITPVANAVITASVSDSTALGTQVMVAVQKFQAAGANTVVIVGGLATEYPPIEAQSSYRPVLMFTSASDATAGTIGGKVTPAVLKNALAADIATDFNDPANQACMQTMEAAHPNLQGKLINPTLVKSGQPTLATSVGDACYELGLFTDIAGKAGKDLNYDTFQQAGVTLGKTHIPGYSADADYTSSTPYGDLPFTLFTFDAANSQFVQQSS
jgi:hypothetical protein